jgi:hypothetical protein
VERINTLRQGLALANDEPIPLKFGIMFPRGNMAIVAGGASQVSYEKKTFICLDLMPPHLQEQINTFIEFASKP